MSKTLELTDVRTLATEILQANGASAENATAPSGVTSRSAHSGCGILGKAYLVVKTATAST